MKRHLVQFLGLLTIVVITSALSCWVSAHYLSPQPESHGHSHSWIHKQLGITGEQDKLLEPIERRYHEERRHYIELIRNANKELAVDIQQDKGKSARIDKIVEQIHEAMGGLQKITLNHVFDMKEILNREQYEKLLSLTADGLHEASGD